MEQVEAVPGFKAPRFHDAEIPSGSTLLDHPRGQGVLFVEAQRQLERAGFARLRDVKHGAAEFEEIADSHVPFVDPAMAKFSPSAPGPQSAPWSGNSACQKAERSTG